MNETLILVDDAPATLPYSFARKHGVLLRAGAYRGAHGEDGRTRSVEAVLQEGDTVVVLGYATREMDSRTGAQAPGLYRDGPPRLVLCGNDERALMLSDDPSVF